MKKALLFLNGQPPEKLPELEQYGLIACTDGAFHYLKSMDFPLHQLNFISGDFDSHSGSDELLYAEKFMHTPDQEKTDFQKALEILVEKGASNLDVYGGSGGEMDHFLGNLTVAFHFKNQLDLKFYDAFSEYYFIKSNFTLENVQNKMISLYPFPTVKKIITKGLNWELNGEDLDMHNRIGTRNFAVQDKIEISYEEGELLIFVGRDYL